MPVMKVDMVSEGGAVNADTVDGFHASQTPTPNTIPVAGPTGKLDAGWLPEVGNFNMVDFSSSGTWTVPSGVTKIIVIACAAGGGGYGGKSGYGGEGGYSGASTVTLLTVSPDETLTITVGAGGTGGGSSAPGGTGGDTVITGSVSGTLLTLSGGIGGRVQISANANGFPGMSSLFGRGGQGGATVNGEDAPCPGAGGGGGGGSGGYVGGAGGSGYVRIIYSA